MTVAVLLLQSKSRAPIATMNMSVRTESSSHKVSPLKVSPTKLSPTKKSRGERRKFRIPVGPSLFVIIMGIQVFVVWHFLDHVLPSTDTQSKNALTAEGKIQIIERKDHPKQSGGQGNTNDTQQHVPLVVQDHPVDIPKDVSNSTSIKLWHRSNALPPWIQEYFDWADEQQRNLTQDNWQSHRYVVMQCLKSDARCGGTSDRMKPMPLVILTAMRSKRLFYIRWTRPCPLEEFLLPPQNSYNWSMPEWLATLMDTDDRMRSQVRASNKAFVNDANTDITMLRARLQTFDGGSILFNEELNNTGVTYESIYHDLFRTLFQPTPPVQQILDEQLKAVGLTPGEYATSHYRAFYGKRMPDQDKIRSTAINAVECASQLRPGGPVYFASDSAFAIQSIKNYAQQYKRPVVIIESR